MANVFFIPSGPKNLRAIFPGVDWDNVKSYTVSATSGGTVATSPLFQMKCCPEQFVRIHFLNSLGAYDAVSFLKPIIIHEDTADEFQNPLPYPLAKTDTGVERFNIKANNIYEAKLYTNEEHMPWLRELADSPKMFLEWTGTEGQADDYLPVVKIAGKFEELKNFNEWRYEFVVQFKLSNSFIGLRN